MNWKLCFSAVLLVFLAAFAAQAQRTPLTPVEFTGIEHAQGGTRDRLNPTTKKWEKYDLETRIVYDEPSGNFLLQWNGIDGKRKTIVYRPANRMHAVVSARVEFDSTDETFRYKYALRNLPSSKREVQSFYLEAKASVHKADSPDESWSYSAPLTDYLMKALKVQGGWTWAQVGGEKNGLSPGVSTYGFSIQSGALPGIVRCFVAGRPGMKGVGEDPPEELMAALDPVSWLIPSGVTVGPVAPPRDFDRIGFLKEIETMISVSLQQGWILAPGLAEQLTGSIHQSIASLQSQEPQAARQILERLLKQVEGEKENRLLSESYALLKYNTEYLLSRIP